MITMKDGTRVRVDLQGQVFGKLTVVGYAGRASGGTNATWHCRCDCGNGVVVVGTNLKRQTGCYACTRTPVTDLTGRVFGELTVLSRAKKQCKTRWVCRCSCGKETEVQAGNLNSGHTTSCGRGVHKIKDLAGERFGRLLVVGFSHVMNENAYFHVRCDCGTEKTVRASGMVGGAVVSCGCFHKERTARVGYDNAVIVDGYASADHPLRGTYDHMIARCDNPNSISYPYYGARGITVAEEFRGPEGFSTFVKELGPRPSLGHSVDRIDNERGYFPGNLKWSTATEQARNKRNTVRVRLRNELMSLPEFAERFHLEYEYLRRFIRGFLTPDDNGIFNVDKLIPAEAT